MKSAAWSSFQSAAELPDRDDDGPPTRTIPDKPVPGERFIETDGRHFHVYEWWPDFAFDPDGELVPTELVRNLNEADARLLAFGSKLLKSSQDVYRQVRDDKNYHGETGVVLLHDAIVAVVGRDEDKVSATT